MADTQYNVIFQGEIAAGRSQDQVKQALAGIFKRQPQELDHFFSGKPVIIQKQVNKQTAAQYKNAFEKAGAVCVIVPAETPQALDAEVTAPDGANQRYHLVFRGEILPGKHVDVVKQILAAKFKLTPQQVASYFSGKPCQLTKAPVNKATAAKYKDAFEKAGARCHILPMTPEAPQPSLAQKSPQNQNPMSRQSAAVPQASPEVSPMPTASQHSEAPPQPTSHIVPPPLPDVPPPMPKMPAPRRRTPSRLQQPKKKTGSNLWILAIVLPFAFLFFFGIVAAIAVPNLLTAIQRSKVARTRADIRAIGTALGSFQIDMNTFPVTEDWEVFSANTLPPEYYDAVYQDAWGNGFFYASDGKTYRLISYGKDMLEGGSGFDADIVYVNGTFGE